MPRYQLTSLLFLLVSLLLTQRSLVAQEKSGVNQPNVLFILTDDQGWADIGYNNPKVYSPNIDALANEGAKLLRYYSMPQCTPSRVALLTGRYPGRFGNQALKANNDPALPLDTPTLARMFKSHGYATSIVGKWHLGYQPDHRPNAFGFDESYGLLTGACGAYDHRYRIADDRWEAWHRNGKPVEGNDDGTHVTDLLAQEAIRFIKRGRETPFFLYLPFSTVHTPLDERGAFVDQPTQLDPERPGRWRNEDQIEWFNDPERKIQSESDPEKRLFLAAVHHLDYAVGEVVKALEASGQRENTLIIFSSDNGPEGSWGGNAYPADLKLTDFNQPLPMRGMKKDVWEGGIHVPGFLNWPGRIESKEIATPLHIIDWYPTLASLLGGSEGSQIAWDGVDASHLILDDRDLEERDLYWIWNERTNRWALSLGDWKIVKYGTDEPKSSIDWELYNLQSDPTESQNVVEEYPDIVSTLHDRFLLQRAKDKKISVR